MNNEPKKLDLTALASIPLIMTLANSMLIPILPQIQKQLGITATLTSLIITIYAAVSIVCIPIAGYLSDRFGRKIIIIIGLSISALGGAISAWAAWKLGNYTALYVILIGRFVQGIGAAGAFPIVLPLVGDMFRNEDEVSGSLGIIETSNIFGKVLSPILGSALALVIWFLPLAVIPLICIISIVAVAFLVKVPKKEDEEPIELKAFLKKLRSTLKEHKRWLYSVFIVGGLLMYILFGVLYFLSTVLEEQHGIDGIKKGLLLAIPLGVICIVSFIAGKLIGKIELNMKWYSVVGAAALAICMGISLFCDMNKLWLLLMLLSAGGAGIGLALPSLDALLTKGIEKEQRGTITAIFSSMRFIGVAAGPLLTSLMLNNSTLMFSIFLGAGILCCGISWFGIRQ